MNTTNLSQAVFLHVGEIYEQAVDAGMHLGDVQRHLGSHGIHKPMLAIKNELNNLYCFYGYADSHPAPRVMSYAEVDAALAKSGQRKQVVNEKAGVYNCLTDVSQSYTNRPTP